MPGKTTILDRLVRSGGIKPKSSIVNKMTLEDPLQYGLRSRQFRSRIGVLPSIKSQREMYQRGIDARNLPEMRYTHDALWQANDDVEMLESRWSDAVDEAKRDMAEDWSDIVERQDFSEVDPYYLDVETPSTDLRDYWNEVDYDSPDEMARRYQELVDIRDKAQDRFDYVRSPEYRMQLQTESPRYRNYQRAMENRAANKRMGHQLSRMWGDAYNRLRARGLDDVEARMYLREYFGGR